MKEVKFLTHLSVSLISCAILAGCGSDKNDEVPTVSAVSSVSVKEKRAVTVTAAATDDQEISGYSWSQISGPELTLAGATSSEVRVTAPEVEENSVAVLRVSVTDNANQTAQADVTVNIAKNLLPDLAINFSSVKEKSSATIQANATDADGEITSYQWTQLSGPEVALSGANTSAVSFEVPAVSSATTLSFSVSVMDDDNESSTLISDVVIDQITTPYTLTGTVTEAAFAGSTISATVAGATFSTTADASGNFSLSLAVDDDATNLFTTVKASSASVPGLEFYKLVPDLIANVDVQPNTIRQIQAAKRNSGSAVSALADEANTTPNTSLSALSTAHYALLIAANGYVKLEDLLTYNQVEQLIDPDVLIEAAALVHILSKQQSLPEGVIDVVSLLNNAEVYNTYKAAIEAENPDAIADAIAELVSNPQVVEPIEEASLVGHYVTYMPAQPSFLSRFGEKLIFNADNTGAIYTAYNNHHFNWSLSEQALDLKYSNAEPTIYDITAQVGFAGLTAEQLELLQNANKDFIEVRELTVGAKMWRIVKGNTMDVYRFEETTQRTFVPVDLGNGVIISTEGEQLISSSDYFVRNINTQMPLQFTATEMPGSWLLRSYADDETSGLSFSNIFAEAFEFSGNGTGTTEKTARNFSWSVNDAGTLIIDFTSKIRLEFKKLEQLDDKSSALVSVYDAYGNLITADTDYALKLDGTDFSEFEHVNPEGFYWNSMINLWNKYYWDEERILWAGGYSYFGFMFNNDNTGYQMYQHTGEPPTMISNPGIQMSWTETQSNSGATIVQVNRAPCSDDIKSACNIRNYRLLKTEQGVVGRRMYVQEESFTRRRSTDQFTVIIPPRLNIYEQLSVNYWNDTAPAAQSNFSALSNFGIKKAAIQHKLSEPNKLRAQQH
ncbi:PKD domain-containing protein [Rheinheimera sp.]|uniref:PKD domain-containing protein n=1 Tax=Rheinheimera sp. TaxID=1869214 RepID=UPI002B49A693|nr:hypothetical protein [Rheinheimera sp.]